MRTGLKRRSVTPLLLLGVLLAATALLLGGCAGGEPISRARINAELSPAGELTVVEELRYELGAKTLGLARTLDGPLKNATASARLQSGQVISFAAAGTAAAGDTGQMTLQPNGDRVVWTLYHQFPEEGGPVTVTYRYTRPGLTTRYADSATLTWEVLGRQGWPRQAADFSLRVALPLAQQDRLTVRTLEVPAGAQWNRSSDGVSVTAQPLQAGQRLRLTLDFPASLLPYQTAVTDVRLAELRANEDALARRSWLLGIGWALGCALVTGGLCLWLARRLARRGAARPLVPQRAQPLLGITAPAELSTLMPYAEGVGAQDVVAMLLHLIHRNHLTLLAPEQPQPLSSEYMDQARLVRVPGPRDTLLDGEFFLIHWFIDLLGDGKAVTLGQIRRASPRVFAPDYKAWRRLVNRQIAERPWFEDLRLEKRALLLSGAVMVIGTLALAVLGASPWVWLGLPIGAGLGLYALRMRRRTAVAEHEVQRWESLARQLEQGRVDNVRTVAQWERILLYAEALGLGREAAQAMQRDWWDSGVPMPWPDVRLATFLAWPLLESGENLPHWFTLLCGAVEAPCGRQRSLRQTLRRLKLIQ